MECFFSDSRMQIIKATNLDRKSGKRSGGICRAPCGPLKSVLTTIPGSTAPGLVLPTFWYRECYRNWKANCPSPKRQPARLDVRYFA